MFGTLVVNSWVGIHEGCGITCDVQGGNAVFVTVSGEDQPFEFFFEAEALRAFLEQGTRALAEMDRLAEQEEAERETREGAAADHAGGRST